jgi:4'-phosphopantetheinyl transferase
VPQRVFDVSSMMISAGPEFRLGAPPVLTGEEVHIWLIKLDTNTFRAMSWENVLSGDERERARRFRFCRDRTRFSTARGLLRLVLSAYLHADPHTLCFCYSPEGKPSLDGLHASSRVKFNVSHSEGVAVFAVTQDREIGVDVERVRFDFDLDSITERFFSVAEQQTFMAIPASDKPKAFFNCWTRKEAFLKAKGGGLSLPLDQFDVSLLPGQPARLLATRPDTGEAHRWSLMAPDVGAEYAVAIVMQASQDLEFR